MPDYGHSLQFGSFLTPTSTNPEHVVELAVLAESSGLDLVTFQDHPYQPKLLDAWTLMTWVAAKTTKIRVAGNVMNVPLRLPSVLARQAAALDLLSGGRVALALGAGAFWDAIEAMGVTKQTPGESVVALGEAIQVIRGILDTSEHSLLRVEGDFYSVSGTKRGPALDHDIPIWIGALKPRLLRLIGRQADGWLPSQAYLKDGDLALGNSVIDRSALAAERDPREIVRLLNVHAAAGVDELVELALTQGISAFIVASDSPSVIEDFGTKVAPAVRAQVAQARGTHLRP